MYACFWNVYLFILPCCNVRKRVRYMKRKPYMFCFVCDFPFMVRLVCQRKKNVLVDHNFLDLELLGI